ncbi:PREDICTED: peroxisomal membrane protein 11C [Trachymyrmex cornetzi]|uniref:Peroxisomal membrane protein 11C n=1 Tax=Trachymyrmex cornetzi TaxID=471704 RepID=A0A195EER3_9HYME|nr:PREDICTED: peroxisomal membrane protein 11C [Trachymyrmex cornetzi]XP_018358758.1 PREDICTED: peroxisomal membrane protein 11C [Trachymyrmex cornetzi]XP_018358759.1 PREDICTED: peroxisomal membrane protein 11C [Trachymyrmex cornetzi]KYN23292.1 Peroxisomal membrane protein 11C [Trachymyrmex cornetzi]
MDLPLMSNYLETYSGRDKMLRTLSYAAKLLTVCTSSKSAEKKLKTFGSQMSECRVMLRLLDDLPALHYMMTYGWGKQEPDWLIRWSQVIQNVVDVIYSPIEHIAWAGQHNIVSINNDKWDLATTWFWIVSLHLSLLKSSRLLQKLQRYKIGLKKSNVSTHITLQDLNEQRRSALLTCTRIMLDISYAISYLPPGVLWGGRLKTWHVGALGTISSLIGLYQALSRQMKS